MQRKSVAVRLVMVLALAGAASWAAPARADWIPYEGARWVRIDASSSQGRASKEWLIPTSVQYPYQFQLGPGEEVDLLGDGSVKIATINSLNVAFEVDPAISLNFSATAGAADTTFTVTSVLLNFPAMANPLAYATAGITATDNNGDTAVVTGLQPGSKAYEARYNGASVFADLVNPIVTLPFDTLVGSERLPTPAPNWQLIPGSVTSMQTEFQFKLSALDQVGATSRFEIITPEPATLGLLLGGGVMLLHRRRR